MNVLGDGGTEMQWKLHGISDVRFEGRFKIKSEFKSEFTLSLSSNLRHLFLTF